MKTLTDQVLFLWSIGLVLFVFSFGGNDLFMNFWFGSMVTSLLILFMIENRG